MAVIKLGLNNKSSFLVYEETPIFISYNDIHKIQGAIDVREVVSNTDEGVIVQAKTLSHIPNLDFHLNNNQQKSVKSSL